jgi:phosphoglycolate phosphatase
MPDRRLVIFDVDGTLVDSRAHLWATFQAMFEGIGHPLPPQERVISLTGLSLEKIIPILLPEADAETQTTALALYRGAYREGRLRLGDAVTSPFFAGAREVLERLRSDPGTALALATGKSRRGIDGLIEAHGLVGMFDSIQCADNHPSKPEPSMILAALAETGVAPARAAMVGDTSFDMEMARAASVRGVGVCWGFHPVERLAADAILRHFDELPNVIDQLIGPNL